jgi:hypothetical protein
MLQWLQPNRAKTLKQLGFFKKLLDNFLTLETKLSLIEKGVLLFIYLFIYLFIMLCQFHTIISAQIQTQESDTIYQSINGRVYATALRQLQQPLQNEHDTFYIRSLVI